MKHYKLIAAILIALTVLMSLHGCAVERVVEPSPTIEEDSLVVSSDEIGFEEIASYMDGDITYIYYRCRTTNTMYVWREHKYLGFQSSTTRGYGGFTAMLDPATGGPLTYENWLAYLKAKTAESQGR